MTVSWLCVGAFEHTEDLAEGCAEVADGDEVHRETAVGIGLGQGVTIGKQNVSNFLLVMSAGVHSEDREISRGEKYRIYGQGANRRAVAVITQAVDFDVLRRGNVDIAVVHRGDAPVPVVIAALGLRTTDLGQLGSRVLRLVAARAEQDSWLSGDIRLEHET